MSGKNYLFLTVLMSAVVFAGCGNVNVNVDNAPAEDVSQVEEEPGEDVSATEDTSDADDDGTALEEPAGNVSDEDILNDLTSRRYNGFQNDPLYVMGIKTGMLHRSNLYRNSIPRLRNNRYMLLTRRIRCIGN